MKILATEIQSPADVWEVREITGDEAMRERLHEMGFTSGKEVKLRGRLPFGGPLLLEVGNGLVALRQDEAGCLWVERKL